MRRSVLRTITAIPSLAILLLFLAGDSAIKGQVDGKTDLPPGDWSFSAHPYFGLGYDSRPVVVTSVTSDASKGLSITKVKIRNMSVLSVSAVKLGWILFDNKDREGANVLQQEQTPLITPSGGLAPNQSLDLDYPVVSFAKICKSMLNRGRLYGAFRIEVLVTEITYADGSNWIGQYALEKKPLQTVAFRRNTLCYRLALCKCANSTLTPNVAMVIGARQVVAWNTVEITRPTVKIICAVCFGSKSILVDYPHQTSVMFAEAPRKDWSEQSLDNLFICG